MIWKQMFIKQAITATDRLGNQVPTGEYDILAVTRGRFSPWTKDDVEIEGREFTMNSQRYLIPVEYNIIKDATHVEIDGKNVEIVSLTDNAPRWTIMTVRKWRA